MSLRIEGQEARRVYWEARGTPSAAFRGPGQIPAAYIQVDYDAFMYMHQRVRGGYEQIDLRPYYLGNDTVPALV